MQDDSNAASSSSHVNLLQKDLSIFFNVFFNRFYLQDDGAAASSSSDVHVAQKDLLNNCFMIVSVLFVHTVV